MRDLVTRWLGGFLEVGSLMKRLDTGEGSYAVELEEDYCVYDALGQVHGGALGWWRLYVPVGLLVRVLKIHGDAPSL